MKKNVLFVVILQLVVNLCFAQVKLTNLICENSRNPIGLDALQPELSWQLVSDKRNVMQTAYEIRVGNNEAEVEKSKNLIWSSGKIASNQSVHVPYNGKSLQSNKKYFWQVRVWDNAGKVSEWSDINYWQMGLLHPSDWTAKWITSSLKDTIPGASPIFRRSFTLNKPIKTATVYITAHGLYEAQLNGKKIGNDYLTPGWTSYHNRLQYQCYDITNLLKKGQNAIGFILGDGWYRGTLAFERKHSFYGNQISGLLQLVVEYIDGSKQIVQTDENWKYTIRGPIKYSDIYNGETYDARLEKTGWSKYDYPDKDWDMATILPGGTENLICSISPPTRKHEELKPIGLIVTPKGDTLLDFGQNLVGWVHFKVKGKAGSVVKIAHAEVLDKEGNFYTTNLRTAKQQIIYTLKGGVEESFEPHFTYQGFRYIKVEGYPGKLDTANFRAIALYSDMKPTGTFTSSNALLNQLQHNIQWGQKGNFVDVPTDCPQRDERLGWTGDAQVFSRTASFNMDVENFFSKWMKDVKLEQKQDGSVPFVVPTVLGNNDYSATGWSDVTTIIPWNMYLAYGDTKILREQYSSMKAWVGYMENKSKDNLWNTGFHFGDWLFYSPDDDLDGRAAITDKYLIAQCFYAHSTQLLINTAKLLGKTDDLIKYTTLLHKIKAAFLNEYVTPNGRLISGTQTAYVLALNFDMLPDTLRTQAVKRLVKNVLDYDYHLTTGFLGTPYLCHVLTRFGYTDIAYKLLLQETYPSWLYPIKMGATTIWERWNGIKPDSTFQNPSMNSFNHYAYGAIGDWMYRVIAGLDTDESGPGYKKSIVAPHPGGNLKFVSAVLQTLYGPLRSEWNIENGFLKLDITIPNNTTAIVNLPAAVSAVIKESGNPIEKVKEISDISKNGNDLNFNLASGTYHFEYSMGEINRQLNYLNKKTMKNKKNRYYSMPLH